MSNASGFEALVDPLPDDVGDGRATGGRLPAVDELDHLLAVDRADERLADLHIAQLPGYFVFGSWFEVDL